ncbi:EAL domain-containing protein [Thalassotalea atypica]|uniref:EAL domain-containing protein n=1 Tax=Thalassotalea atypica TaxID=2054316 RepID=UPI002572570A|nr:EAL domain-containing protein [Thalassotalea atypica]
MQNPNVSLVAINIAQKNILHCLPDTKVLDVAKLLKKNNVSSIVIKSLAGENLGIWTEADATKIDFAKANFDQEPISKYMSFPLISIAHDVPLPEILLSFTKYKIRHLLVHNGENETVGIISQSDIIKKQGIEYYLKSRKIGDSYNSQIAPADGNHSVQILVKQMADNRTSAALAFHPTSGEIGIITQRDLVGLLAAGWSAQPAWKFAKFPVISLSVDDSLLNAYVTLKANHIRHLAITGPEGQVCGLLTLENILADIEFAHLKELESILIERDDALALSERSLILAEKIIASSPDGIVITNDRNIIVSVNPAFSELTGYQESDVLGNNIQLLSSGIHDDAFYEEMWSEIDKNGRWKGEVWNKKKSGEPYLEALNIIRVGDFNDKDVHYAGIFSDITARRNNENKIQAMAFYDELTGLPNRRLFNDRLEIAISSARRHNHLVGLLFLDLDRFKQVNDTLGHSVGDELLKIAAKRIESSIKQGDTVSRLGGDEFVILLSEIASEGNVVNVIERITDLLNEPFIIDDKELYLTSSIGAAVFPEDGEDAEELLINADIAMYKAKDSGRNSFQLFHQDLNVATRSKATLQNNLIAAAKNNEFSLNFQLQYDVKTKRTINVEALLRWHHEKQGQISPALFIPVAEELGVIVGIEKWVLIEACNTRKSWLDKGIQCGRIAVNISARHFKKGLVASVLDALEVSGLAPEYLEIEIVESSFIDNFNNTENILNQLKAIGIKIALDDFGTGYSSLSYLTRLPIDVLKIDRSFVAKIPDDKKDSQMVSIITAMAKGLDLDIVAEGVEEQSQVTFLTEAGCSVFQGFYYCKPESAAVIEQQMLELGIQA